MSDSGLASRQTVILDEAQRIAGTLCRFTGGGSFNQSLFLLVAELYSGATQPAEYRLRLVNLSNRMVGKMTNMDILVALENGALEKLGYLGDQDLQVDMLQPTEEAGL